jgi:hypothetical protein
MNMTMRTIFEQYMENPEHQRIFEQERVLVDAAELVSTAMEFRGVNRSELRGSQNLTLKTLADMFYGLNCRLVISAVTEAGVMVNRPWNVTHETSNAVVVNEYKRADQTQAQDQDQNQNPKMAYAA